jgi:MoxR-like ATPase
MLSCSPGMTESQILGRSVPKVATGEDVYRVSEFVKLFENGGVFLFDEMDAADPSVLLVINAALANGKVPVPNRPEKPIAERHADFVCIAAANTWGTGANREYVGRNPLDEATLDRFRIGTVPCDYVEAIERAICPDMPLFRKLKGWREKMREAGVKRIISTRFFKDAYDMRCAGDEMADIEMALFGGWKGEEVVKVLGRTIR